jgi:phosphatidylglycerol:prolipoprotein diacylglycerol transferase
MNNYYIHDIDPYLLHFPFELGFLKGIPWYGTMYLLGFIAGYYLIEHLRKTDFFPIKSKEVSQELINYTAYGVIIGGRLGHFLFYETNVFWTDPLQLLKVWEGGMASHGGMIGVMVSTYLFAKKHNVAFLKLWDVGSLIALPGLFFGRIGNFINGEMPGKITDVSWAVIFPNYGNEPRHPSQIYQALGEGVFMFLILWFVLPRKKFKNGFHLSMFFVFYGIQRIVTESFRAESEALASFTDLLTQGQILSIGMILLGFAMLYISQKREDIIGVK